MRLLFYYIFKNFRFELILSNYSKIYIILHYFITFQILEKIEFHSSIEINKINKIIQTLQTLH